MKCKITFNTPFGKLWNTCQWRSLQDGGFWKGEHMRGKEKPFFVSGLNQRLTEICLVGIKIFSMGNMTSKVARCFERSRELVRGVAWSATKSAGRLLLFVLQMAPRRVRGQSDHHICKHTSPPEHYFEKPPAWPCHFWQVNVCNASTYKRTRCVIGTLHSAVFIGSSLSNKEKLGEK